MDKARILWVDDEVESLTPHVVYLETKGYQVAVASNAADALKWVEDNPVDAVLLDEHMPGRSGLDALPDFKRLRPMLPVIMVTKSEEDGVMEMAIGESIADYLLKPVQPRQVLSSLTRVLGSRQLVADRSLSRYQTEFRSLSMDIAEATTWEEWTKIFNQLIQFDDQLKGPDAEGMRPMLEHQKEEANRLFTRWWAEVYPDWLHTDSAPCLFSHQVFDRRIAPVVKSGQKSVVLVFDNLRLDQWLELQPFFMEAFSLSKDEVYASLLPTATQYARNALLSGMLPKEIAKRYAKQWVPDTLDAEGKRNGFESELLKDWAQRQGLNSVEYAKLTHLGSEQKWVRHWPNVKNRELIVVVVNFIDMISHAKTEQSIVRDIASDDRGFRALTHSWWKNSPLRSWVSSIAADGFDLFVTTDHGTISVKQPITIKGSRNLTANMRYKIGRGLEYGAKEVALTADPEELGLPTTALGDKVVFAGEAGYFIYPNQYHQYAGRFEGSYQHGGISMEELIIPLAHLKPRRR
jgi:CheY-like chemotaxis protein